MGGEGRGGRAVVPHLPPPGGWPVASGPDPLHCRRIPPRYTCSAGAVWPPRAPGAAWPAAGGSVWWGGGGWLVRRPHSGARPGGTTGRGTRRLPCCGLFTRLPGRVPRWVASFVPRLPHCIGSRLSAAVPLRPTGRPCAPAQGRRPAAGTAGVGGRLTGGTRRTAVLAAAVVPLPGCRGPPGGGGGGGGGAGVTPPGPAGGGVRGRRPPGRPPAVRWSGGKRGGGRGGGGRSPSAVPWRRSPAAVGGRPGVPCPGGPAVDGGGCTPLLPLSTLRALGRRAGPRPRAPRSPRCRRLTAWCR